MATNTFKPLATLTLSSTDAEVVFTSIPNIYKDLVIVFDATSTGDENLAIKINNSTSDFSNVQMTSAPTETVGTTYNMGRVAGSNPTMGSLEFMDYAATDRHKYFFLRTDYSAEHRHLVARWAQNAAISQISLSMFNGFSFSAGSTFSLFGVG